MLTLDSGFSSDCVWVRRYDFLLSDAVLELKLMISHIMTKDWSDFQVVKQLWNLSNGCSGIRWQTSCCVSFCVQYTLLLHNQAAISLQAKKNHIVFNLHTITIFHFWNILFYLGSAIEDSILSQNVGWKGIHVFQSLLSLHLFEIIFGCNSRLRKYFQHVLRQIESCANYYEYTVNILLFLCFLKFLYVLYFRITAFAYYYLKTIHEQWLFSWEVFIFFNNIKTEICF